MTVEVDLEQVGDQVTGPDPDAETAARVRLERAGRLEGLGRLADLAVWWAGVRGIGAAGPPHEVFGLLPPATQPGTAPTTLGPAGADTPVRIVDLDPPADPRLAVRWGVDTADALVDAGAELVLVTAADPVPSRVLAARLLGLDPVEANGWPEDGGIDDDAWMEQVARIRDGLYRIRGLQTDPVRLLAAIGSPVLGAATGLLLRSAARRTPALLDGPGAAVAALVAQRLSPYARDWWQVGQLADHPIHQRCLDSLRLTALTRLGVDVEDGTGCLLGLAVLDLAAGLLATA